ncbi:hypothetical protein [Bauldia sp.]|uniref:hypothetical protein n=1 Tax=Bauldia sp. TaxID=2575872 RepID=UPI003BA9CB18
MANAYPGKRPLADKYVNAQLADISAAGSVTVPVAGQGALIGLRLARSATTTGTAAITVALNGTALSGAVLSVTAGAATDVISVDVPPAAVKDGDVLAFTSNGGSTGASTGTITAVIREL